MAHAAELPSVVNFPLQQLAQEVYERKYQLHDRDGTPIDKSINDTYKRVAKALAQVEKTPALRKKWEKEFLYALQHGAIPAGRIASNAGAEKYKPQTTLINCTVSGIINDSMEGILTELKDAGITLKSGAGIGYNFSTLRPKGAFVNGVGASTSGPLSFMDVFDSMCNTIASAGGRRGAQMATFHIYHPDVLDFVTAKQQNGRWRQFNVSVLVTDEFIEALEHDKEWHLYFPVLPGDQLTNENIVWKPWHYHDPSYTVIEGDLVKCKIYKTIRARELWDSIMKSAYEFSEPGILHVDFINKMNNAWFCEEIHCSNPCGEVVLPPHGACLLGSINLTKFVVNPFSDAAYFDYDELKRVVAIFTRMLDNVVEISGLPLSQQRQELENKRRHGMGVLGLASALTMLGVKYGSKTSLDIFNDIMAHVVLEGYRVNAELAEEKGPAPVMLQEFEVDAKMMKRGLFNKKIYKGHELFASSFYFNQIEQNLKELNLDWFNDFKKIRARLAKTGGRFTHHTAIAPTGTIAASFGNNCSGGLEPTFAHKYTRNLTVEGKKTRQPRTSYSYELLLYKQKFGEPEELPDYFVEADDLTPQQHIDMQAVAQRWVDQSISKTINLDTNISFEDFKNVYRYGIEKGVKGTTVFRYNPETLQGVLVRDDELEKTLYEFKCADGRTITVKGNETVWYEGEEHNAAMLYDSIKEGRYDRGY